MLLNWSMQMVEEEDIMEFIMKSSFVEKRSP